MRLPSRTLGLAALTLVAAGAAHAQAAGARTTTTTTTRRTTARVAPGAAERGGFVVRLGTDTTAVESYTRTATRLEGDVFNRGPSPRVTHYVVTLDGAGQPTRVELRTRRPDGTPVPGGALGTTITFRGDSALAEVQTPDSVARFAAAGVRGAVPAVGNSYAMWETAMRALRTARRDSGAVRLYAPGAREATVLPARFVGRDSAQVVYFGDPMLVKVDAAGRLLGLDGSRTSSKITVERRATVDVASVAQAFATRPMGQASPRDTARATVGTAELLVDYGRPSVRGRTVWGGTLVPDGQVWRLGANAATQLRTSADLVLGGTTVPAGTYTLFLMPNGREAQLVVNRQTGQWGTEYQQDRDLARVPATVTTLASPVEQFTIAIEPGAGNAGTLVMRWADRQLAVPFTVK